jgi:hypothetical protein
MQGSCLESSQVRVLSIPLSQWLCKSTRQCLKRINSRTPGLHGDTTLVELVIVVLHNVLELHNQVWVRDVLPCGVHLLLEAQAFLPGCSVLQVVGGNRPLQCQAGPSSVEVDVKPWNAVCAQLDAGLEMVTNV